MECGGVEALLTLLNLMQSDNRGETELVGFDILIG